MGAVLEWIKENQILSGVGVLALSSVGMFIRRVFFPSSGASAPQGGSITINNNNQVAANAVPHSDTHFAAQGSAAACLRDGKVDKSLVRILFVDDDTRFQVVKIIKGAGWPNVKIVKDVRDLSCPEVVEAHIIFVDIQGVGGALGFADEGLGLTLELKRKYPEKKVIIYSAQTTGDRFHRALNKADGSLSKNAEPYQFISLVEELLERH